MLRRLSKTATAVMLGLTASNGVQAALFNVDPGPYTPANAGFAAWYQDTHGRVLDLCLSKALSSRAPVTPGAPTYMCSLLPEPGVFDDTQDIVFPGNFPSEAFWFTADAFIQQGGINLSYGAALEAAFNVEQPVDGDQISFARIRIRVDLTTPGSYTITHPYGVEVVAVTAADIGTNGVGAINLVRDIGIGAPGVYTGALGGDIGPFLRSLNGPYTETNPATGASERFVGDPNLTEAVTGSPFDTNYVRIQGPNGIDLRTELFAVSGKLSSVQLSTPLIVERNTYSRSTDENGATVQSQDVFVQAPPPPGSAHFVDSAAGTVEMTEANGTGNWYGQSDAGPTPRASLAITADNSLATPPNPPTTLNSPLVDQVTIGQAQYSLASGQLLVVASSSDQTTPPGLSASVATSGAALGPLSGTEALKTLNTVVGPIPPARVTVISANGGSDTEEVLILP
ncbi:hypothetical protein [Azotobacter beijerinckii]|uniref:Uncharacterized protein n=1 Tax=Azotobacter beijerinckii TaxID=170623 RepID=A0A1I1C4I4_9GAMM|nr:hypothetical protein [Azotobacter beijerinckii]SFB55808.1 hypothetical protein SAMN04244571_03785 [Azotobacter beijerinckii]